MLGLLKVTQMENLMFEGSKFFKKTLPLQLQMKLPPKTEAPLTLRKLRGNKFLSKLF